MAPSSGDPAPDFELPGVVDGHRSSYRLSELAGHPVVLVFNPGDNTPVCTRQLNAYSTDVARFSELDARILAISPQGLDSHEAFAENEGGFAFPLLADEDKAVGRSYGVLGPMGFYRRCVFVVDGAGRLAYVHRGFAGSTFRRSDELVEAIRAAG
jgi:peroxiredoxin